MSKLFEFYNAWGSINDEYYPVPASSLLPEWYKTTSPFLTNDRYIDKNNFEDITNATIKQCMPFLDSINSGYIIKSVADVLVTRDEEFGHFFQWANYDMIGFHNVGQARNYPGQEDRNADYAKWKHPWVVKTPKGYSTLFVTPMHRDLPFKIFEGIVDTDNYFMPIAFPFVIKDPEFEGLIPAGTPIAQAIPIKRENWKMSINDYSEETFSRMSFASAKLRSVFYYGYKSFFWNKKKYS